MVPRGRRGIKKVMFVNPFPYYARGINEATIYPPLGIAYMASVLEREDIECRIVDANILRLTNEQVLKKIGDFDPDMVGIFTNIVIARSALELSRMVKERLGRFVVLGGPFATSMVNRCLKESGADCVVRGEGEKTIVDIVRNPRNLGKIKGISYVKKDAMGRRRIVHNPKRELITNLNEIPFPAYHLLPSLNLYKSRSRQVPMAPIFSSRGCPFQCIYCNKNIFGSVFRTRSPENIVDEIEYLVKKYGVRQIDVLDDNFTLIIKNAERVFDLIIERRLKVLINLQNGVRADRLTRELVRKMRRAGVFKVGIGIESGDESILKVVKKNLDLRKVRQAIRWFREEGIITYGFFMIGLPQETKHSIERTIDFAIDSNPHLAAFSVTIPFPGTELYSMIEERGEFIRPTAAGTESGFLQTDAYYRMDNLDKETVKYYERVAFRRFYMRPSKMLELLATVKSFNEFKWTFRTAANILRDVVFKSN